MKNLLQVLSVLHVFAAISLTVKGDCIVPEGIHGTWHLPSGLKKSSNDKIEAGQTLTWTCNEGYFLLSRDRASSYQIQCIDGMWDKGGSPPTCDPKSCSLPQVSNGKYIIHFVKDIIQNGTSVFYSCNPGFRHDHDRNSLVCHKGKLHPSEPLCLPQGKCKRPDIPNSDLKLDWRVNSEQFLTNGTTLVVHCRRGHHLKGPNPIYCNGTEWNGQPTCIPLPCDIVENVGTTYQDIYLPQATPAPHNTNITAQCTEGFTLEDHQTTATCRFGSWRPSLPICTPKACAVEQHVGTIYIGISSGLQVELAPHTTEVKPQCRQGFFLNGTDKLISTCQKGIWVPRLSTCVIRSPQTLTNTEEEPSKVQNNMVIIIIAVVAVVSVIAIATVAIILRKRSVGGKQEYVFDNDVSNQNWRNQTATAETDMVKDHIYAEIPGMSEGNEYLTQGNCDDGYLHPGTNVGRTLPSLPYEKLSKESKQEDTYKPLTPPTHPKLIQSGSRDSQLGDYEAMKNKATGDYEDMRGVLKRHDQNQMGSLGEDNDYVNNPVYMG